MKRMDILYVLLGYALGSLAGYAWGVTVTVRRQEIAEAEKRAIVQRVMDEADGEGDEEEIDWGAIGG